MKKIGRALVERVKALFYSLVAIVGGIRLLFDPNRLDDVFVVDRAVTTPKVLAKIAARARMDPTSAAALARRRRMPRLSLDALGMLPEGTLGRTVADFMQARGLDPASIPRQGGDDEASFVRAHLYETHDVWHVVTGFDTDVAGELAVQAFYSAQLDGALPRLIVIGGLVNARLGGGDDWARRLDAIACGWTRGKAARPLFGVAWDELWQKPLDEVRAGLGIAI